MARPEAPVRRSQELAWFVTIPLALVTVAITVPLSVVDEHPWRNLLLMPFFAAMFVGSRVMELRFDIRREGITIYLVDLPLLFGFFYLSPPVLIVLQACAVGAVDLAHRTKLVKSLLNVAATAAAIALGSLIMYMFADRDPDTGGWEPGARTWLVLAVAVLAQSLISTGAVICVITMVQGRAHHRQYWWTFNISAIVTIVSIVVSLIMLLALQTSAWALLLMFVMACFVGVAYRSYAGFVRRHGLLAEMYDLTRALGATGDTTLFDVLLTKVGAVTQAESATLWLQARGRYPEVMLSARVDYKGLLDNAPTPEVLRRRAVDTGEVVMVGPKVGPEDLRAELQARNIKDAIVVPLRSGGVVIGTLEVAGRLGDKTLFEPEDARFVESVAVHASVAVENSRLVDRLRFDAAHDALTTLPNRRRMLEALSEAVGGPALTRVAAVLLFDIVGLRQVNESLGYEAGDKVLIEVASRLRSLAPDGAMVARVGGDEFVVEVQVDCADAALSVAEMIRDGLRESITVGSLAVDVDATVGVAVHPEHGSTPDVLLQRAEVAAYIAKAHGSIQLFNAGLESRSVRRLGLASDLRRALDCDELEVYFQPKMTIGDQQLIGVECLARWEHPVHGSVAPMDVVAVAEHTGQLGRLTEFVLREGLRRARRWATAGREISVAVNVAARTLLDAGFPAQVVELLEEYDVPADRLTIEITEDAMAADTERPLPTIHRLHDIGVRLSVDDFGTGYSSMAYLRRLPIQEIKVDKTFVQGMATDPRDLAIVRTIVDMARYLGLTSVAEGVESELTLGMLRDIGVDVGQGFLFSRPLPYDRLDAWLRGHSDSQQSDEVRRLRAVRAAP